MMRRFRCGLLCMVAFGVTICRAFSANADTQLKAAWDAFNGTFYDRTDNLCAEYTQKFPTSPHLPEVFLLQARARLEISNYAGAIQLLSKNQDAVGVPKDQFIFWMAEARLREGKVAEANELFARLVREFPASTLRAEATMKQAVGAAKLNDWPKVVNLLANTNGAFQQEASTNSGAQVVLQGYLLLGEAYLKGSNYAAAKAVLEPLGKRSLNSTNAWAWNYLRCRVQRGSGDTQGALATTTNLAVLAADTGIASLRAETADIKGEILEELNRPDEAIAAYTNNLLAAAPAEHQKQAVLRISELSIARTNAEQGAQILERFARQKPPAAAAGLASLKNGELRLREFVQAASAGEGARTNLATPTNRLGPAVAGLQAAVQQSNDPSVLSEAYNDLGWCYWFQEKFPDARDAFAKAVQGMKSGTQRAKARLKLADAEFKLNEFDSAVANYTSALEELPHPSGSDTNLVEPALYQTVRAALAGGNSGAASNALSRIVTDYPNSFYAGSATLLFGRKLGEAGSPGRAREVFAAFLARSPDTGLKPELGLAIARTYEQDGSWPKAVETYDAWLQAYTNHASRPEAMFFRGQALFHAGDETNAYACFTNFVAQYPKHSLAAEAQWAIADRYFQTEAYQKAENDFQLIALNWPGTELSYEALMMAGRAAFSRQGWNDAMAYFVRVSKATNCPPQLYFSAIFAYADTLMSQVSTNKEADYARASESFDTICQQYSTNYLAALACGQKAICQLQLARSGVGLTNAAEAFRAVLTNEVYANGHAISVAKVGLGVVLEKQAALAAASEQAGLRKQALGQYLDVLDGLYLKENDGDEFWAREAAISGVRLATDMQEWEKVISFCDRIAEKVPKAASSFDEPKRKAVENLARGRIAAEQFDRLKTSD